MISRPRALRMALLALVVAAVIAATAPAGAVAAPAGGAAVPPRATTSSRPLLATAASTAIITRGYDLGRAQLSVLAADGRPHRLPTRLLGEITVAAGAVGRLPVVVILHGAHQSCVEGPFGTESSDFPCLPGWEPVESYTGYRYLAERLAREGFLVLSVDGRPVAPFDHTDRPFPDGAKAGDATFMDLRARIVDAHLRRLVRAGDGEVGPDVDFPVRLAGRVDASDVGLVGHSRGGEGVVWASLIAGPRPYRIRSILAIAPTDFGERIVPAGIPFAVILPTCDGDVSDLEGARFFDDARNTPRTQPLLQIAIHGANHDFFNEVWPDEWSFVAAATDSVGPSGYCAPGSPGRVSRERQEAVGAAVVSAFLRGTMRGTMRGATGTLASLGIGAAAPRRIAGVPVTVRVQEPTGSRFDIAPMGGSPYQLAETAGGGRIAAVGVEYLALCRPGATPPPYGATQGGDSAGTCPPTSFVQAQTADELRLGWSRRGARLVLPPATHPVDLRSMTAVSLSVAPTPPDADPELNGPEGARPFSVVLVDADGRRARVAVPSTEPAVRSWPTPTVLGTVRIALARFRGVDLGSIVALEVVFDRTARGAILISDVAFVR